jgi:gas vesicle protein
MEKTSGALTGILAGVAAGVIIGILMAPDKGSKTRKKIIKKAKQLGYDVKENLDDLKVYVNDFVDEIKGRFNIIEDDMKTKTRETAERVMGKGAEQIL